jgi:anti-anti-sigma factor
MPNVHVLAPHGDVDFWRRDAMQDLQHLDGVEGGFVMIDLTDVSHIDATLLGMLVHLQVRLSQRREQTALAIIAEPGSDVVRVIRATGLDGRFAVYDDIASARKAGYIRLSKPNGLGHAVEFVQKMRMA